MNGKPNVGRWVITGVGALVLLFGGFLILVGLSGSMPVGEGVYNPTLLGTAIFIGGAITACAPWVKF